MPAAAGVALLQRYESALRDVSAPFAVIDLDALDANATDVLQRSAGLPVRLATKSLRCRSLVDHIAATSPRFGGLMTFTLGESLWLRAAGHTDTLCGYPTADRAGLATMLDDDMPHRPVLMVDSTDHLDLIAAVGGPPSGDPIELCIDVDLAWTMLGGRVRVGPKRSPVRSASDAVALAREIDGRRGLRLVGMMGYEGHVAGVGDRPAGQRLRGAVLHRLRPAWERQVAEHRAEVVAAVTAIAPLRFVNGGGTGSLHSTAADASVTELTAGSAFYAPRLFDDYSSFRLRPAAMFALPVVRRPAPTTVTVLGGGYLASGAAGADRLPCPVLPEGLRLDTLEGAGEVQTPLHGEAAASLGIGDRVYFRHAKAGELLERFGQVHLVRGDAVVDVVPTYRGEGRTFL